MLVFLVLLSFETYVTKENALAYDLNRWTVYLSLCACVCVYVYEFAFDKLIVVELV